MGRRRLQGRLLHQLLLAIYDARLSRNSRGGDFKVVVRPRGGLGRNQADPSHASNSDLLYDSSFPAGSPHPKTSCGYIRPTIPSHSAPLWRLGRGLMPSSLPSLSALATQMSPPTSLLPTMPCGALFTWPTMMSHTEKFWRDLSPTARTSQ
ncbi:hypothetical protein MRX96_054170 [Rhipicephalus microplus]